MSGAEATHASTNGPLTPAVLIASPLSAEPTDRPTMSADAAQVKASVSTPRLTARPTSEYRHENAGAIVTPARNAATIPSGIVRAAISGTVLMTVASVTRR